jgi:RNA polymerase sigma-70 factor (ECF subfamily)
MVLEAAQGPSTRSRDALATLCRAYWFPLYAFLRRQGKSPHDAQDLTQAFLLHLVEKRTLTRAQPDKGRFRSFLLASLQYFIADERDKQNAKKRGGGATFISLDNQDAEERYVAEPAHNLDPAKLFERRWATTLIERTLARLESEFAEPSRKARFEQLQIFLLGEPKTLSYAQVGQRLGIREGAVKVAVLRLRQRFRELLRLEIASTVATEDEIEEEMQHLFATLCG